eukprot:CAMPEP_0118983554 /NCGR_PEP_ID=MMETSP1173-20130426/35705_1 /TAXON_ID=1034831 /ORGANISM="Rhizochromulina marina cf, Strain CCMP1243" /LENGTH=70 /DNA_ID=CAMNT_0006934147 /DNA_START=78 /DNA_END=287 /DNA_ORIENTATION=-
MNRSSSLRSATGEWTGRVVTVGTDQAIKLWDLRARKPLAFKFSGHTEPITSVQIDLEKSAIVSGSKDGSV